LICKLISSSVNSGKKLNWPWVIFPVGLVNMLFAPVYQATEGVTA